MPANNALQIYYDPVGYFDSETGERSPLWSASDVHSPGRTRKELVAHILETGWSLSTKVLLPNEKEPMLLSELYRKEFDGKLPGNFDKFQREAKARDHMADSRDPYNTGLSDAALGYGGKRSDYRANEMTTPDDPVFFSLDEVGAALNIKDPAHFAKIHKLKVTVNGFVPVADIPRWEDLKRKPRIHAPPIKQRFY